eukprot:gene17163-23644_t
MAGGDLNENNNTRKFSSFQCTGGSQEIATKMQHQHEKFPDSNDPSFRICKFDNICWVDNQLVYYEDPIITNEVPIDFRFGQLFLQYGEAYHLKLNLKIISESLPTDIPFVDAKVGYLDAHSNSYNYGHYLIDNVIPHFIASRIFNTDTEFSFSRQIFFSSCKNFGSQPLSIMAHRKVPFNESMGSFRQACLEKLNKMWIHFFDYPPFYLETVYNNNRCFKSIIAGQGSAFGLHSLNLGLATYLREFRDYVLEKVKIIYDIKDYPSRENLIVVGERSPGHSGGEQIAGLCHLVKENLALLSNKYHDYKVECYQMQAISFVDEIIMAQRAKILISVSGTISYMSLFSANNMQQIIISDPTYKENNILMFATHFKALYLPWERKDKDLKGLLLSALMNAPSSTIPIKNGVHVRQYGSRDTAMLMHNGTRYPIESTPPK